MLYREIIVVCSEIHTKNIIYCLGRTKKLWILNLRYI